MSGNNESNVEMTDFERIK